MPSFEQLAAYFQTLEPNGPMQSAQATWLAGSAEARELAAELQRNVATLKQYWSGPAATEYYAAMQAIIDFANGLSDDMSRMANGLRTMASMAASIKPTALGIVHAARPHHWTRAAAIAPLTALLNQLGQSYQANKSSQWKEPTPEPEHLPKAGNAEDSTPHQVERPKDNESSPILGIIEDIGKYIGLAGEAWNAYQAFNPDQFPSGVVGEFPVGEIPGGWNGPGDLPGPGGGSGGGGGDYADDPDYQPLPEPSQDLSESPVELAGVSPAGMSGSPAVSLGAGGATAMGNPGGGPMPMGMGMGAAGAASSGSKPTTAAPSRGSGGGLFGAPMGAGARRGGSQKDDEGVRTWLTEDELAWDSEPAPSGIVGR